MAKSKPHADLTIPTGDIVNEQARVVILTAYFTPAEKAGGPVRSLDNLVKAIASKSRVWVVTSDRDHGALHRMSSIQSDRWYEYYGALVYYASEKGATLGALRTMIRQLRPDTIYLNSLFQVRYSILVLLLAYLGQVAGAAIILAPRGELQHGNFAIKKWRKQVFIKLGRYIGLFRGIQWHATSQEEAGDIAKMMKVTSEDIVMIRNLKTATADADELDVGNAAATALRVLFLGRISKEKNLAYALSALQGVKRSVLFDIFGNFEDCDYLDRCRKLAADLKSNIQVVFHGQLPYASVASTLGKYDIMFLPTVGENYGHSIVESLLAGTPVLISDQTPWHNLERKGLGWDFPLDDPAKFIGILESYCKENSCPRFPRKNVKEIAQGIFDDSETEAHYFALFSTRRGQEQGNLQHLKNDKA